jgi:aryl-alcohol dehydrogenase-like predicted oxidoreductase
MGNATLALGTAQLGMDYGIANCTGAPNLDKAYRLLQFALQNNITLWDTSPLYGKSEQIIGKFLANCEYTPQICTKLPSLGKSALTSDRGQLSNRVTKHIERSLRTLGVESIDYYLIHDEHDYENFGSHLSELLAGFQGSGILKHIGLSAYSPEVAFAALEDKYIDVVEIPLNLFEQRFCDVLSTAANRKISIFARSVFLQGLFFLEPDDAMRKVPGAVGHLRKLRELARLTKRTTNELALCYVRDMLGVSDLVVGVESMEQMKANIHLFSKPPLPSELRLEIKALFDSVPVNVLNPSLWK